MTVTRVVRYWGVVCENFHQVLGIVRDQQQAEAYASDLNAEGSQTHEGTRCTYRAIPIYVQQVSANEGFVEYDKQQKLN